ncbi:carbohydrate ABC transporter permease [Actinocorallia lasiicapitis]
MTTQPEPRRIPATPARGSVSKRSKQGRNPFMAMSHVALAFWALLIIVPLAATFLGGFKSSEQILLHKPWELPQDWNFDAFTRAWTTAHIGRYMLNTVIIVGFGTAGTMLLGSMAAYVLARYQFRGNRAIYLMFVSGMTFPVFLALVPLFTQLKQMNMLFSYHGIILVYIAYSLPFTVFFLAAFFKTLPNSVAEAAMMDGAGHVKVFFRVMMPMAKPGLISIAIFNVIGQWNQYLLPLVLLSGDPNKSPLTVGIAQINTNAGADADWSGLYAALTLAIVPVIFIYIIFQRQIQSGLTSGAVK